ncbi:hypothetical protein [Bacillus taeanensis]|uniref:Uncharacterized protein n=1 Tax=Bacillus taeanensis TaxID=273032 RepID=A0A366XSG4_9BACI|nr:hypothetical protein [Bacillus taeanensis]RBW67699.1 hypothetical protein DS031_20720 [Bacillus taeanensis]
MNRYEIHEKITHLKSRLEQGEYGFLNANDPIIHSLVKVKLSEDGIIDLDTVDTSIISALNSLK